MGHVVQAGDSPLYTASFGGHLKCVELLLEARASVDVQNEVNMIYISQSSQADEV